MHVLRLMPLVALSRVRFGHWAGHLRFVRVRRLGQGLLRRCLSEMSSPSGTPQPRAFSAARAALNPPIPWTPPPGGVADEQRYTPGAPVA